MNLKLKEELSGLTSDQGEAFGMMSQGHNIFTLTGWAGTGKTHLIKYFLRESGITNVSVTGPTHKSVGVANGDCTIHSLLSLKLKYVEDKQILQQIGFADHISYGQTVIIDESSMISKELLHYIKEAQEMYRLKIIFCGDIGQLPPVGEKVSPVWKLNNPTFALTEIVRQARDSGIISLATAIRDESAFDTGVNKYVNNVDVFSGNFKEMSKFYQQCTEESSFPHIISHRNKIVNSANMWARDMVMDKPSEAYLPGEEVYVRSVSEDQIHKLEDIVEVVSVSSPYKYTKENVSFSMSVLDVEIKSHKGEEIFTISASPEDVIAYGRNKSDIANRARKRMTSWGKFWKFANSISEIKHIYALTAHRAQGSTFDNVIVNCNDIGKNKRLLYTATTRAAKKVFLYRE